MQKFDVGISIAAAGLGMLVGITIQQFRLKSLKSVVNQQKRLIERSIEENVKTMSKILHEEGI